MKNQIKQFHNSEFGSIEILLIDDKPYFPATECAVMLGYKNPRDAISKHCRGDGVAKRDGVSITTNQHGVSTKQTVERTYISEGNLYRLIIRSKLPAAERFERWVFDEVLPSIRKHGAYIVDEVLEAAEQSQEFAAQLFRNLQEEKARNRALRDKVETLSPKATYCDLILQCSGVLPISIIANDYGTTATKLNRALHRLGIQYKVGPTWLLYNKFSGKGYTRSRTYLTPGGAGIVHTCWTQKGRLFLYETLKGYGILPLVEIETEQFS